MLLPLSLSGQASPYVPIDDIAYSYVDALMARDALKALAALERPYTASAIRAAADSSLAHKPTPRVANYLRALEKSLERYELRKPGEPASDTLPFRTKATFDIYVTAETSARQELMLADAQSDAEPGIAG